MEPDGRSGSGSLSSADVQSSSSLSSTSGLSLEDGSGGGLASNYTLTGGSQSVSVTKRPVVMSGSREYDGTNTISASDVSFVGTVGSDDLSVSGKMTVSNGDIELIGASITKQFLSSDLLRSK